MIDIHVIRFITGITLVIMFIYMLYILNKVKKYDYPKYIKKKEMK